MCRFVCYVNVQPPYSTQNKLYKKLIQPNRYTHCKKEQAKETERKYLYSAFMKNNYPRNFINKILTKIRNKQQSNIPDEQPEPSTTRITLPYINHTSEMTARLLRPFNIDVAHKPTHKLRSNLIPRLFSLILGARGHLLRKYPGIVWSRVSQNLGGNNKFILGWVTK